MSGIWNYAKLFAMTSPPKVLGFDVRTHDGSYICSIPSDREDVARLIAGAPAMSLKLQKLEEQRDVLLAALKKLEREGWLRHLEEQAISVEGSEVAEDVRATVKQCRDAIEKATQ